MAGNAQQAHWQQVYGTKTTTDVSWYQETPAPSLELIERVCASLQSGIIDIGGGASVLVDHLLSAGYRDVTVLDLSAASLSVARARLGKQADRVEWVVDDVTTWQPARTYDLWHDRAAFHFLVDEKDQAAYVERLRLVLRKGGHAVIGTFAPDGPEKCSGLPIRRYDAASLGAVLGQEFQLVDSRRHDHVTPWGATQRFQFSTFRREG